MLEKIQLKAQIGTTTKGPGGNELVHDREGKEVLSTEQGGRKT